VGGIGFRAFSGTRIPRFDLSDSPGCEVDFDYLAFLEVVIYPRKTGEISLGGCSSLKSLTVGGAKWLEVPSSLDELRFTSLDGRLPADFAPCIDRARVFSELAAVAGRLTRGALLP
jgi:hypothetical protein